MEVQRKVVDGGAHARLAEALGHAAHLLPAQGPIGVFIHHNTLHAWQHLPFEQAVEEAGQLFGAEPYLSKARYREEYRRGRIDASDLEDVLGPMAGQDTTAAAIDEWLVPGLLSRRELRRLMMLYPILEDPQSLAWRMHEQELTRQLQEDVPAEAKDRLLAATRAHLGALVDAGDLAAVGRLLTGEADPATADAGLRLALEIPLETEALRRALARDAEALATQALWVAASYPVVLRERARAAMQPAGRLRRHRDLLLAVTEEDIDDLVNPVLIRLMAAFLDQGVAYWPMPDREQGFYLAVRSLCMQGSALPVGWLRGLREELRDQTTRRLGAADVVLEILGDLGVPPEDWDEYVSAVMRGLPGWAGLMNRLEKDPSLAPHGVPPCSLVDFLAVRLIYTRCAIRDVARRHGLALGAPLHQLVERLLASPQMQDARAQHLGESYRLFRILQLAGVPGHEAARLPQSALGRILAEMDAFPEVERRRLWHLAYERHYRVQVLGALAQHGREGLAARAKGRTKAAPRFQLMFCVDEREESLRRHIEELGPDFETFGALGFFGVAVYFRGVDDAQPVPLCPVVVRPEHGVVDRPVEEDTLLKEKRHRMRRLWANLAHGAHVSSRAMVRGWLASFGFGVLSAVPLIMRVLSPRLAARMGEGLKARLLPAPRSELTLQREEEAVEASGGPGFAVGFKQEEKIERVARVLEDTGLVRDFGRLVVIIGHGSSSRNNPHESAYDCGACGGRRGKPNGRLFAQMANRPGVREGLRARGIDIPESTIFIGGYHDTCSDAIELDTHEVPATHAEDLAELRRALEQARRQNAHERCRRFEAAPLDLTPDEALAHVEARSEHLAEPRPEYGHATNAVCYIGRRELTRGLFFDRRAFLVSYDPTLDPDGHILARSLAGVVPVGVGISLEYYFSHVDNQVYGCGTKIQHNVTGLLGVMNGHASDLQTGLSWQMVEIHEPMRLLAVIETHPELLGAVVQRNAGLAELVRNRWLQVATVDPETREIQVLGADGFAPLVAPAAPLPVVPSSVDWYRGRREHLPLARIARALSEAPSGPLSTSSGRSVELQNERA
ncbi:MAG TPA: DUF2309 domain-containing protein [Polyangia bacterium]|nr:DUF2309 domain-containing protein [Polyangia bacterium]